MSESGSHTHFDATEELLFALRFMRLWERDSGPAALATWEPHLAPAITSPLPALCAALLRAGLVRFQPGTVRCSLTPAGESAALGDRPDLIILAAAMLARPSFAPLSLPGGSADELTWPALHPRLLRPVCVRLPVNHPDTSPEERSSREQAFLARHRAQASLDHPAIARVLDIETGDHGPVSIREWCRGGSLRPLMGTLPPASVISLLRSLLEALSEAHAAGVHHGALTEANVLFDGARRPRLTDFTGSGSAADDVAAAAVLARRAMAATTTSPDDLTALLAAMASPLSDERPSASAALARLSRLAGA